MELVETLSRFRAFSHFDRPRLERLAAIGRLLHSDAGQQVLTEGDPAAQVILVLKGAFRIQHATQFGPLTLGHVLPGDLLGDMGYIDGKPHAADALAETDVDLLSFGAEDLTAQANEDSAFAMALLWTLWRSLSGKLRKANAQLAGFFGSDSPSPLPQQAPSSEIPPNEFRVGLTAKRDLFQEQRLSPLEINLLASLSKERRFSPGDAIFREGEPGKEMFVVLSGSVVISKFIPGAGDEALAILGRGDYFGEMALIDQLPRSASARAHDDGAAVLAIPRDVVEGLLDIERVSSLRLLRLLCSMVAQRLRECNGKLLGWYLLAGGHGG